jgi:hypothetical protein
MESAQMMLRRLSRLKRSLLCLLGLVHHILAHGEAKYGQTTELAYFYGCNIEDLFRQRCHVTPATPPSSGGGPARGEAEMLCVKGLS